MPEVGFADDKLDGVIVEDIDRSDVLEVAAY
jgi:hypothetical protein